MVLVVRFYKVVTNAGFWTYSYNSVVIRQDLGTIGNRLYLLTLLIRW